MRKLLSATLFRMTRSKALWALEAFSVIASIVMSALAVFNARKLGDYWYLSNGNFYFWLILNYIGVMLALFSSSFGGVEYSEGTLRNKLVTGHCRRDIYLVHVAATFITGLILLVTHAAVYLLIGLPFLGSFLWDGMASAGWRAAGSIAVVLGYSGIFSFLSMVDESRSRSIAICLILALSILLFGLYTYSRLQQPELTSRMVMQEDGSFLLQEGVPNSRYVSGSLRSVFIALDAILPASLALRICSASGVFDPIPFIGMIFTGLLLTLAGIVLFSRKDIK